MKHGYKILDADRHVIEPMGMWKEYLPKDLRDHAPHAIEPDSGEPLAARLARLGPDALVPIFPMPAVDGTPLYNHMSERAWIELCRSAWQRAEILRGTEEPQGHLDDMDRTGIDAAILYPTYALLIMGMDSIAPAVAGGFARAYNRWILDFCAASPERLRPVALISLHDPRAMVPELLWAVEHGFRAAVVRPNPTGGRRLSDPAHADFWAACERLAVAVVVHEATHAYVPAAGADRFQSRFALHACSHPMEQMMAILDLIEGGVLLRHPGLRVAFLEAGCTWLPYWLWRLDSEYKHLAGEVAEQVRMAPSAYFRDQCLIAAEPDEPLLAQAIAAIGEDSVLFGTDFPHLDHDADLVDQALALRGSLPAGALQKLLWDNGARFFGI